MGKRPVLRRPNARKQIVRKVSARPKADTTIGAFKKKHAAALTGFTAELRKRKIPATVIGKVMQRVLIALVGYGSLDTAYMSYVRNTRTGKSIHFKLELKDGKLTYGFMYEK